MIRIAALILALCLTAFPRMALAQENDALAALVGVLKESNDPQFHLDILKGIRDALKGQRNVKMPAGWEAVAPLLSKSTNVEVRQLAQQLSVTFGSQAALATQRTLLANIKAPVADRLAALESLVSAKDAGLPALLPGLLNEAVLRSPILRGMAAFDDAKFSPAIIAVYPKLDAAERKDALSTLSARPANAGALLGAIDAGKISAKDVTADLVRQLRGFKQPELAKRVEQYFGVARATDADMLKEIATLKKFLEAKAARADNLSNGRVLYTKICAQCHTLYGEGAKIGPDITGSNRADLDYLLTNILDPNAEIAADYRPWEVMMKDERELLGLLVRQDAAVVVIQTITEQLSLPRTEIKSLRQSQLSMMPEGLVAALSPVELRDLIVYLRSPKQVPLPK
ncbi:MAG: c-type cytochrome [Pedosphaera sp.]|nr:c-type cytochrome [Pedosphaera sp.]